MAKTLHEFVGDILAKRASTLSEDVSATPTFTYPPPFLTMKRKAVRAFPDGQHVAVYYISQINKFISIPFGTNKKNDQFDLPALGESVTHGYTYKDHAESGVTHIHHNSNGRKTHIGTVAPHEGKWLAHHIHGDDEESHTTSTHHTKKDAMENIKDWHHSTHQMEESKDTVHPNDIGKEKKLQQFLEAFGKRPEEHS